MQQSSRCSFGRRRCTHFVPTLLMLGSLLLRMAASESASKPTCENGRLTLRRDDPGQCGEEGAEAEVTRKLAHQIDEALTAWSMVPGGCKGTVVFEGAAHCGQTYELPGAYNFHGHGAHLELTLECTQADDAKAPRAASLHSAHGVYLFRFTGGASIHAWGIGFQGGTGKWGGAVELSGEGRDSDSAFDACVFDHDLAASSGGAVIVEGAIDPDTTEPTTARFTNCVFTHNSALQGGALFVAATKPGRARAELQGCYFNGNEAYTEGGAVYVAGDLVLKGKGNRFTGNHAGHHDADVYVDEALGGRVLHESAAAGAAEEL